MELELKRSAYSPRMRAEELKGVVGITLIRRAIAAGHLKAFRVNGRNLVILAGDALEWLTKHSATEPTAYHAKKKGSSLGPRRDMSVLDRSERHFEMQRRRDERAARKPKPSNDNKQKR